MLNMSIYKWEKDSNLKTKQMEKEIIADYTISLTFIKCAQNWKNMCFIEVTFF